MLRASALEAATSEDTPSSSQKFREWLRRPMVCSFVAGGAAGAVSRTVVSPFERMKIIYQIQRPESGAYTSMPQSLTKIWREEGWRGFLRGNGINLVRVIPYSAVQFCTYTVMKQALTDRNGNLSVERKLLAGSISGIACVISTYPLDLLRTRISVQTAQIEKLDRANVSRPPGIWQLAGNMIRNEGGIFSLYRGLTPTMLGVAPYVALNFVAYEWLRDKFASDKRQLSTLSTLLAGAVSGGVAQTILYPLDVLRRRFQVATFGGGKLGYHYKGTWDALSTIARNEGFLGLWTGLSPNLFKVVPAMATSFWTFEAVKRLIMN